MSVPILTAGMPLSQREFSCGIALLDCRQASCIISWAAVSGMLGRGASRELRSVVIGCGVCFCFWFYVPILVWSLSDSLVWFKGPYPSKVTWRELEKGSGGCTNACSFHPVVFI